MAIICMKHATHQTPIRPVSSCDVYGLLYCCLQLYTPTNQIISQRLATKNGRGNIDGSF